MFLQERDDEMEAPASVEVAMKACYDKSGDGEK